MGKNKRFFSDCRWTQDFYQSMDSRRRKYIDKVIDFLLRDTIIDYEDNHIDFPFFPMYRLFINDENLGYFYHKKRFDKYCMEQYGLTEEETFYVWTKYMYSIRMNIGTKGGTEKDRFGRLDESDDRRKIYLSKVIGFLVKDTIIDYSREKIQYPFPALFFKSPTPFSEFFFDTSSESFISFDVSPFIDLYMYCNNTYGLTEEETVYVWEKYKTIILDKIENGR